MPLLGVILVLIAACGSEPGPESRPSGGTGPPTTLPPAATATTAVPGPPSTAAPRWETVATLSATGPQTFDLAVLPEAIQWRVRWSCETDKLRMETTPPPRRGGPMLEADCPGQGEAFSIQTGSVRLAVTASGPWKGIVDQQVDRPLDQPPPEGVASAMVVAEGSFHDVEKPGHGRAVVYAFPDGRRVLRFEDFEVAQNTDLFVWLSQASAPRTSAEATSAPKVVIGNLKSTIGNQNYDVPPEVPTGDIRSIVIWCEPVRVAYSAASLSS